MTYTGAMTAGGLWATRELDHLIIRKLSVGPMDNNAYLLTCQVSGDQLMVDAAAEPDRLLDLVRAGSASARLSAVVTTHRHPDHHGGLESIHAVTGAELLCGDADADAVPVRVTRRLHHGDVIAVGHVELEVIGLRGHTPGSIALAYREPRSATAPGAVPGRVHLFTGDSLFPGGPGRTTGPEDFRSLMTDLEERVFAVLEDHTWVYPGHGADTTLGAERPQLAGWWERGW